MKKSTIWILTIVMALTFVGLLYMQFVYMEEMINMREQHFDEGVKRSLYSLSTTLERNETSFYIDCLYDDYYERIDIEEKELYNA